MVPRAMRESALMVCDISVGAGYFLVLKSLFLDFGKVSIGTAQEEMPKTFVTSVTLELLAEAHNICFPAQRKKTVML